jgi:N utilization substance protein B
MSDPASPADRSKGPSREEKRQMRSAARLYAVQALFQMEASGQTLDAVRQEFETHRFGAVYEGEEMAEGDPDLFRKTLEDAVNWQAKIDQMTDRALVAKWPIDRIDPTLRALFRAAGAELSRARRRPRSSSPNTSMWPAPSSPRGASRNSSTPCSITWRARRSPRRSRPLEILFRRHPRPGPFRGQDPGVPRADARRPAGPGDLMQRQHGFEA